jgi:hypothetical protein
MSITAANLPRPQQADIASRIHGNLVTRKQDGLPEPGIDAFIPETGDLAVRLGGHVDGKIGAIAARITSRAHLETVDGEVDTYIRHVDSFLVNEGRRRNGPHAPEARALHKAVFPHGIGFIDDPVPEENLKARKALSVLRSTEHKDTLAALEFPMMWLDRLEKALDASDAALEDVKEATLDQHTHVSLGQAAEADFVDVMNRLRKYIGSRAGRKDVAKRDEGRKLLAPLLEALAQAKAEAAARKTRKQKAETATPAPSGEKKGKAKASKAAQTKGTGAS